MVVQGYRDKTQMQTEEAAGLLQCSSKAGTVGQTGKYTGNRQARRPG